MSNINISKGKVLKYKNISSLEHSFQCVFSALSLCHLITLLCLQDWLNWVGNISLNYILSNWVMKTST